MRETRARIEREGERGRVRKSTQAAFPWVPMACVPMSWVPMAWVPMAWVPMAWVPMGSEEERKRWREEDSEIVSQELRARLAKKKNKIRLKVRVH
eukprot:831929-Amorphochlora_amoeboformis.AAC.1